MPCTTQGLPFARSRFDNILIETISIDLLDSVRDVLRTRKGLRVSSKWFDIDGDGQRMLASTSEDASDRGDIGVVSPPRNWNVVR